MPQETPYNRPARSCWGSLPCLPPTPRPAGYCSQSSPKKLCPSERGSPAACLMATAASRRVLGGMTLSLTASMVFTAPGDLSISGLCGQQCYGLGNGPQPLGCLKNTPGLSQGHWDRGPAARSTSSGARLPRLPRLGKQLFAEAREDFSFALRKMLSKYLRNKGFIRMRVNTAEYRLQET